MLVSRDDFMRVLNLCRSVDHMWYMKDIYGRGWHESVFRIRFNGGIVDICAVENLDID